MINECSVPQQQEIPLQVECSNTERIINEISERLALLEDRLRPFCRALPPETVESPATLVGKGGRSSFIEWMSIRNSQAAELRQRLESLLDRLEI